MPSGSSPKRSVHGFDSLGEDEAPSAYHGAVVETTASLRLDGIPSPKPRYDDTVKSPRSPADAPFGRLQQENRTHAGGTVSDATRSAAKCRHVRPRRDTKASKGFRRKVSVSRSVLVTHATWNSQPQRELKRNPMPHSISYFNVCLV